MLRAIASDRPPPALCASETIALTAFRPEFADELVCMWRQSFESAVGIVDPHPIAEQRAYLMTQVVPRNAVRVVRDGERIVGFIAASRESVAQLYLAQSHCRRGIGTMLLDWAKAESAGKLWLYTFARNQGARAFYEHHGFRIVARGFEQVWQLADIKYEWVAAAPKHDVRPG